MNSPGHAISGKRNMKQTRTIPETFLGVGYTRDRAGLPLEAEQDLPLRTGHTHAAGTAIKCFAKRMRSLANFEGKSFHRQPI